MPSFQTLEDSNDLPKSFKSTLIQQGSKLFQSTTLEDERMSNKLFIPHALEEVQERVKERERSEMKWEITAKTSSPRLRSDAKPYYPSSVIHHPILVSSTSTKPLNREENEEVSKSNREGDTRTSTSMTTTITARDRTNSNKEDSSWIHPSISGRTSMTASKQRKDPVWKNRFESIDK